jgi:hypothetical protein
MNHPQTTKLTEEGQALLDHRENAVLAIRIWEQRGKLLDRARASYEETLTQNAKNRYERECDAYKVARNFAISMMTRIGKKLTVDGLHYRSIPSRCEIKVTPCKRPRKEPKR